MSPVVTNNLSWESYPSPETSRSGFYQDIVVVYTYENTFAVAIARGSGHKYCDCHNYTLRIYTA